MNVNVEQNDTSKQEAQRKETPKIANAKYYSSPDKTDSNIVIVLHGLGDWEEPFARMAQAWKLPQTAVLAMRAPLRIPLLEDEDAFQWWPSFNELGETVECKDPRAAAEPVVSAVKKLHAEYGWPYDAVHVFGYGQGGQVAASAVVALGTDTVLGSVTTCCAPFQPQSIATRSKTPVLVWRRREDTQSRAETYRAAFENVREHVVAGPSRSAEGAAAMPADRAEWKPVFEFLGSRLRHRHAWEFSGEVYRVV